MILQHIRGILKPTQRSVICRTNPCDAQTGVAWSQRPGFSRAYQNTEDNPWPGTEITRPKYQRDGLRYASDTADAEWQVIEPHLPPPAKCGRTRETDLREHECDFLHRANRLPVAPAAHGFPAVYDGAALLLCLEGKRLRADQKVTYLMSPNVWKW
jgi:hypothetical protein